MLSSKSECFRKLTPLCGTCLRAIAGITGVEQRWIRDAWYVKFGMGPNPEQRGNGDTTDQVGEFVAPDAQILVGYYTAVRAQTDEFLDGLDVDDPDWLVHRQAVPLIPTGPKPYRRSRPAHWPSGLYTRTTARSQLADYLARVASPTVVVHDFL